VRAGLAYLLSLTADDDDDDDDDNNNNNDNDNDNNNVFQLMKMLTSKDSSCRAVQASSP